MSRRQQQSFPGMRRAALRVTGLESRAVPATLVNPTTVTYQDVDGDAVTVRLTRPLLTAGNVNTVFTFDAGSVNGDNSTKQQLQHIGLESFAAAGNGTGIAVTAVRGAALGDGFANVGYVSGWDLGAVSVKGDLGAIDAGDPDTKTTALASLAVQSMGRFAAGASNVMGRIGSLMVKSDFVGGSLQTFGAGAADDFHATIGSITIGGSYSGSISSGGDMGIVRIGGDVVGGAGGSSGRIFSGGKLAAITIGGDLVGGAGDSSGTVESAEAMGPVKVAGDMRGGAGAASGSLYSHAALAGVTLGGSLVGGTGSYVVAGGYNLTTGSILSEGALGSVKIARDVQGGAGNSGSDVQAVRIGSITVGGSFAAGPVNYPVIVAYGTKDSGGQPLIDGSIGRVQVAGSIDGGQIICFGTIAGLRVGGSVTGPDTQVVALHDLGPVVVRGDIREAQIRTVAGAGGRIASVTVGGSILGGDAGNNLFTITNTNGTQVYTGPGISGDMGIGKVTIGGDLVGGAKDGSGTVLGINGPVGPVSIRGSVRGGAGQQSGAVFSASTLGPVTVGGSIAGGAGVESGEVITDPLGTGATGPVTVGGSLVGGAGVRSGRVFSIGDLGPVKVAVDVRGGDGMNSGDVVSGGNLAAVTVGGSLVGGGKLAGFIGAANIGPLTIAGNVRGGSGSNSGRIFTAGRLAGVTVGGSVVGAQKDGTGEIRSGGDMGPVRIGGDLVGGDAPANGVEGTGYVQGKRIASVFIGGSVRAGTNDFLDTVTNFLKKSGTIRAVNDLGPVTVEGSLIGSASPTYGNITPVIISARGQATPTATTDLAIAGLTVLGRVERANILAGYDADLNPVNADAQIGPVHVGGDWVASNLVAGVDAGGDGLFGTEDDVLIAEAGESPTITARIGDVRIDGQVLGTPAGVDPNDHYGVVAELVHSFKVGGTTTLPLAAGPGNDAFTLGTTGDVGLLEVPHP